MMKRIELFWLGMSFIAIVGFTGFTFADATAPVEKTGQTTSYATSDDGDLEKGIAWPNPRFTDNSDGTVTDNLTGLIWLKDANRFGARTWFDALNACNTLADDGSILTDGSKAGDWRLPNVRELQSLVNYGFFAPTLPNTSGTGQWSEGDPFNNVQSERYWTSTTFPLNTGMAKHVAFSNGLITNTNKGSNFFVWCVRDGLGGGIAPVEKTGQTISYATGDDGDLEKGIAWPNPRFTDNSDGTVTDNLTGLTWLKDANRFGRRSWNDALNVCNELADDGSVLTDGSKAGDWRLPNTKELTSIVHYGFWDPGLPNTSGTGQWSEGNPFINMQVSGYWTSSTNPADGAGLDFTADGGTTNSGKSNGQYVWCVKGEVKTKTAAIEAVQDCQEIIASLDPGVFKNASMQNTMINKLNDVIANIEADNYEDALEQLQNDILKKIDGCATSGGPDKNDWIIDTDCEEQMLVYQSVMDAIVAVEALRQ